MSAYIVDREHVRFLVTAATSRVLFHAHNHLSWVFNVDRTESKYDRSEIHACDQAAADRLGQLLWTANVDSVLYRYEDCPVEELPGAADSPYAYGRHTPSRLTIDPVAVLKAIAGYEYQSCEANTWTDSEACAFCEALRRAAINALPGYEEAAWSISDQAVPAR